MKKEIEILSSFYELMIILEKHNLFLTFNKNKIILYSYSENKLKKIIEGDSVEKVVEFAKNNFTKLSQSQDSEHSSLKD
ncbi:MAG: hypothetical protein QXF12_01420 [Candidatus Aenigmatarchaeota archaeon]